MNSLKPANENINDTPEINTNLLDNSDIDISVNTDLPTIQDESNNVDTNIDNNETIDNTSVEDTENIKEECTALVVAKPNSLFVAQAMFKKSIKISIKSFLISLWLGFLNLFI